MNKKLLELAQVFRQFNIYPKSDYTNNTPAKVFINTYPENHYAKDLREVLKIQPNMHTRRGADLPYWGEKVFVGKNTKRNVMIIAQDSKSKSARSIVLHAHLMNIFNFDNDPKANEYKNFVKKHHTDIEKKKRVFKGWVKFREFFKEANIDLNYVYITDAKKVYLNRNKKKFDDTSSENLLKEEIRICDPKLIVSIGSSPLNLLQKYLISKDRIRYACSFGKVQTISNRRIVVIPFLSGNGIIGKGRTKKIFEDRVKSSKRLIQNELRN